VLHVEQGMSVQLAADAVMSELRQKTSGEAGLILADRFGNVAIQFDTPHMPVAIFSDDMEDIFYSMTPKWPSE